MHYKTYIYWASHSIAMPLLLGKLTYFSLHNAESILHTSSYLVNPEPILHW